jgi:hypothetical protein
VLLLAIRHNQYRITKTSIPLLPICDERNGEAVVPFAAHSLNRRGTHARLSGKHLEEALYALDARISTCFVDYCSFTYDIIDDDQATTT